MTSLVPTQELPTVAWTEGGVQVNYYYYYYCCCFYYYYLYYQVTVSLQTSLAQQGQILVRSVSTNLIIERFLCVCVFFKVTSIFSSD